MDENEGRVDRGCMVLCLVIGVPMLILAFWTVIETAIRNLAR